MEELEIMKVGDVANFLQISHRLVYELAAAGAIRSFRVRGAIRFRRVDVDLYISNQIPKEQKGVE